MTRDVTREDLVKQALNSPHLKSFVREVTNNALLAAAPRLVAHLKSLHSAGIGEKVTDTTITTILGIPGSTYNENKGGTRA